MIRWYLCLDCKGGKGLQVEGNDFRTLPGKKTVKLGKWILSNLNDMCLMSTCFTELVP